MMNLQLRAARAETLTRIFHIFLSFFLVNDDYCERPLWYVVDVVGDGQVVNADLFAICKFNNEIDIYQ